MRSEPCLQMVMSWLRGNSFCHITKFCFDFELAIRYETMLFDLV